MIDETTWDWQTDTKKIRLKEWYERFKWVEELHVSPDGENIAAIINYDEAEFGVCVNGKTWEDTFEKAWSLKFAPDGKLAVLASKDEEWSVCVDGGFWETWFDFIWDLEFTPDGRFTSVTVQKDMQYGMAVNDEEWDTFYENITGAVLSDQGDSAAVVQVNPLSQADIEGFNSGVFSVALNGSPEAGKYMNAWDVCFDSQGKQIAYSVRKNRSNYSLVANNTLWDKDFQSVWKPMFYNGGRSVLAPVRIGGKWFLYINGVAFWHNGFEQLWKVTISDATKKIAAVVSESFGKWTICENNTTWPFQCNGMISDLFYSRDGSLLTAVYKHNGYWDVAVNGKKWKLKADKLWAPVISRDGSTLVARMEKDNKYFLVVNGKVYQEQFDMVFEPRISPDSKKVLLKTIKDGTYERKVLLLDKIT